MTLMTIHASKGLEFRAVVLVDTAATVRAQPLTMAVAPATATVGARLVVRHTRDVGGTLFTPEAFLYHREATAREIAERRRLTYVAMTRAKQRLIVLVPSAEPTGSAALTLHELLPDAEKCCPETTVAPALRYLLCRSAPNRLGRPVPASADAPGEPIAIKRSLPMIPADLGVLSLSTTPFATFAECPRNYRFIHEMGLDVPAWEGGAALLRDVCAKSGVRRGPQRTACSSVFRSALGRAGRCVPKSKN